MPPALSARTRIGVPCRCPALFLRVAGDQGGVEVDHQSRLDPTAAHQRRKVPAGLATQQPRPLPHRRAGPLQLGQGRLVDRVEHSPTGRRRGHLAEQAGLIPKHRKVSDRLPTVGDHHRNIGQHPARTVR